MPVPKSSKTLVTIATVITRDQRQELLRLAAQRDRPVSFLVREALAQYLDQAPSADGVEDAREMAQVAV